MLRVNIAKKSFYKVAKELDAFPKIPEECQETSASGGGCKCGYFVHVGDMMCDYSSVRYNVCFIYVGMFEV